VSGRSTAWLVTGARGQLGHDLQLLLAERPGDSVTALGRDGLDLTDEAGTRDRVRRWLADVGDDRAVLVNAAAYTAVDAAEDDEATAELVNGRAPGWLAEELAGRGRLVHVSTDYVFDGSASVPYPEDAPPAPRSAYGRTKAAGEWAVRAEHDDALVVRTAWLYGRYGRCFPRTIAGALAQREHLDVVADQVGQPTWTVDVADLILRLVAAGAPAGTYHATSDGVASWHAFAQAVAQEQGLDPARVRETTSEAYQRPAPRPAYSVLGHDALRALGVEPIADWRQRFAVAAPVVLGADVGAGAR
jgi:dTDP-4-dehydrorhamnose reductase